VTVVLRSITTADLPQLRQLWRQEWSGEEMMVHGEVFAAEGLQGFIAGDWIGVATYTIREKECEIVSLNSLEPNQGIGTALVEAVIEEARRQNCRRVFLSTTNANLHALGFYQRLGFALSALRPNAVTESRRRKPSIPLVDDNGIPLRDELELEILLNVS
jgi:GNAT superfamily N-acetyltransferase